MSGGHFHSKSYDFKEIQAQFDTQRRAVWCLQSPKNVPSFTVQLLKDILRLQKIQRDAFKSNTRNGMQPFRYFILGSALNNIFNLGGDLNYFTKLIRQKNRRAIKKYARLCVDCCYNNYTKNGLPFISLALLEGDALGGGLEAALSCDLIIAERGIKVGLPEINIGLFPGIGAYSFLSRKVGHKTTEAMIASGQIYSSEELYELGVVDILAEKNHGKSTLNRFIEENDKSFHTLYSIYYMRRLCNKVSYRELIKVANHWADQVIQLSDLNIQKIEVIVKRQKIKLASKVIPNQAGS